MSDLELCYTCDRYGECDVYSRLSSPGHDLLYSCVNYEPTSAKDIAISNIHLSNYSTELALLELEHRYGKEVRDRVEQMGFVIPKHGHWDEVRFGSHQVWRCSMCRYVFSWQTLYCGHCGAKMDEV